MNTAAAREAGKAWRARAPGKVILSGEYAVLYGQPVLAAAVNRHVECTVCISGRDEITLRLEDLGVRAQYSLEQVRAEGAACARRHARFRRGETGLESVIPRPEHPVLFALSLLLESLSGPAPGIEIRIRSTIPVGRGMGSSAATTLALLTAAAAAWKIPADRERLLRAAVTTEHLQHGRSSGADPVLCQRGGLLYLSGAAIEALPLDGWRINLVDSGAPQASTGECVADVTRRLGAGGPWEGIGALTRGMREALEAGQAADLAAAVRANQRMLEGVGVVPVEVRRLVADIEARGGSAKICGAGSIRGPAAGFLWVLGDDTVLGWLTEQGRPVLSLEGDRHGTVLG